MFIIRGADGKEYGPVTAGQLRQWIQEGRAGGPTEVRAEGATEWMRLQAVPEFADVFKVPASASSFAGRAPLPIVRTLAVASFVVAAISAPLLLVNIASIHLLAKNGTFQPGFVYYFAWAVAALSIPLRIVSGVGLLRAWEWARSLTVYFSAAMVLYGGWGLVRTANSILGMTDITAMLRSPMFMVMNLWSFALFLFNLTVVVVLCRRDVAAAFAPKSPANP